MQRAKAWQLHARRLARRPELRVELAKLDECASGQGRRAHAEVDEPLARGVDERPPRERLLRLFLERAAEHRRALRAERERVDAVRQPAVPEREQVAAPVHGAAVRRVLRARERRGQEAVEEVLLRLHVLLLRVARRAHEAVLRERAALRAVEHDGRHHAVALVRPRHGRALRDEAARPVVVQRADEVARQRALDGLDRARALRRRALPPAIPRGAVVRHAEHRRALAARARCHISARRVGRGLVGRSRVHGAERAQARAKPSAGRDRVQERRARPQREQRRYQAWSPHTRQGQGRRLSVGTDGGLRLCETVSETPEE